MTNLAAEPLAPKVQNERVMEWWDYPIFALLTLLNTAAVVVFLRYWCSLSEWRARSVVLVLVTVLVMWRLWVHQLRWFALLLMRRPRPTPARDGWHVAVATTFVPGAESLEMLEVTVRALVALEYPHDTWVLDEGDDGEVRGLCERLGARHFSRRALPQYHTAEGTFQTRSKHGNYNAWLHEIAFDRYEIIAAFDPDHVPLPSFLGTVLGYFDDPEVGYVQAAQVYYNQRASFIARGAAEETYAYYSSIQMVTYGLGHPIITGCHNTHRVTALRQVGGFAAHDADDLLITLLYRARGVRGVYVPEVLAKGLTPVDWSGYLAQQFRWAHSVLDIKFRAYPKLAGKLPLPERIVSLLHGIYYFEGFVTVAGMGLLVALLATGVWPLFFTYETLAHLGLLALVMQILEFYRQRFFLERRTEWGLHWRAGLLELAKWPYFLLALVEAAVGRKRPYALTPKVKSASKPHMLVFPHLTNALMLGSIWGLSAAIGRSTHPAVQIWAAVVIMASVGLICTEGRSFPTPYDKELWDAHPWAGRLRAMREFAGAGFTGAPERGAAEGRRSLRRVDLTPDECV